MVFDRISESIKRVVQECKSKLEDYFREYHHLDDNDNQLSEEIITEFDNLIVGSNDLIRNNNIIERKAVDSISSGYGRSEYGRYGDVDLISRASINENSLTRSIEDDFYSEKLTRDLVNDLTDFANNQESFFRNKIENIVDSLNKRLVNFETRNKENNKLWSRVTDIRTAFRSRYVFYLLQVVDIDSPIETEISPEVAFKMDREKLLIYIESKEKELENILDSNEFTKIIGEETKKDQGEIEKIKDPNEAKLKYLETRLSRLSGYTKQIDYIEYSLGELKGKYPKTATYFNSTSLDAVNHSLIMMKHISPVIDGLKVVNTDLKSKLDDLSAKFSEISKTKRYNLDEIKSLVDVGNNLIQEIKNELQLSKSESADIKKENVETDDQKEPIKNQQTKSKKEKSKTLRQRFDVNKEDDFNKPLETYSSFNVDYYNGHKRTKEEVNKRRNLNAQFKRIIDKKVKSMIESENSTESNFAEKMGQIESGKLFSDDELENVAKNKGASLKLFQIMSSGIYEKDGKKIKLTQKQRVALASTLQKVSEIMLGKEINKNIGEAKTGVEKTNNIETVRE